MTKTTKNSDDVVPQSSPPCPAPPSSPRRTSLTRLADYVPPVIPLESPHVDSQLEHCFWLERSVETLRYTFQSLEYALSPSGRLRQWIKLNGLLFVVIGVPLLLFLPLATFAFGQFSDISLYFQECMSNLLQASVPALILAFLLSLIVLTIKK